jgi:hypothetical protein
MSAETGNRYRPPASVVAQLADFVVRENDFTESDALAALMNSGVSPEVAGRAYGFMQTAWARTILAGLGVQFSPEYLCFNAAGDVVESGRLANDPYFTAASFLIERYGSTPGFQRLALMSADVSVVDQALKSGSKPEDLAIGPTCIFMEPPTAQGQAKAQTLISKKLAKACDANTPVTHQRAKPWWQFW